jgi:bacterioferritin-associated ferredoxin
MCCAVTSHTVEESIRCGARTTKDVANLCGAGSDCGRCKATVRRILAHGDPTGPQAPRPQRRDAEELTAEE